MDPTESPSQAGSDGTNLQGLRIAILALFVGLMAFGAFKVASHLQDKALALEDMKARMFAGAHAVETILPDDYHDRITDADSISDSEYENYRDLLNEYAWKNQLEYIYAYVRIGGKIYVSASSFTKEEMLRGDDTPFFYEFEDPSPVLLDAFDGLIGLPISDFYDNPEWGTYYSVFMPLITDGGKVYVVGADARPPR